MNHVGLARNPALPAELIDRLIEIADDAVATALAARENLSAAHAIALASRCPATVPRLAGARLLTPDAVAPVARPLAELALLATGAGSAAWARRRAPRGAGRVSRSPRRRGGRPQPTRPTAAAPARLPIA